MRKIRYSFLLVICLVGGVVFGAFFADSTFAAGGWISGGAGQSVYDGGPGGELHNCSNIGGTYLLECTGFSWVFYESTGEVVSGIDFRPDMSSNDIDKACSEHTNQNGGFWHFGRNAQGISGQFYNKQGRLQWFNYFGDAEFVNNIAEQNYRVTYSTDEGDWGHMETLNYRLYGVYGSKYYNTETPLNHTIYVDGKPMYRASKYGTVKQVFEDYKKAYRYLKGTEYTGSGLPGNMYAFCYWDDMDQKLTVEGKNIYDDSDLNDGDQNVSGTGDVAVSYKSLWDGNRTNNWKFIGWKESASAGTSNIVTNTNSNSATYVSDPVGVKYDDWTKDIYQKFHVKNLTTSKTIYAYYAPTCKLTIDAGTGTTVNVDRGKSPYSGANNSMGNNSNLYKGDELSITFGLNPGYSWQSHTVGGRNFTSGNIYTIDGSGATCNGAAVATRAVRDEFEGQVRVSEVSATWEDIPNSKKATTGWSNVNGTKAVHNIQNCDPVNGCTVRFAHWLRRTAGGGSTDYSVTRTSNYYSISSGTIIATTTEDFSEPTTASGNKRVRLEDFTNKLYPGQAVCETLTFRANVSVGNVSITACALALGDAQPSNPDGSSTLLDIEVSKDGGSTYQKEVYVKPEDSLKFKATYNPVLQYTYRIIPERMRIDSGDIYPSSGRNVARYLGMDTTSLTSMFNLYKGSSLKNWNNDFTVYSSNFTSVEFFRNYSNTNGATARQEQTNDHSVAKSEVGKVLREIAVTNLNDSTKTTPSQVSFSNNGGYNLGNVITSQIEKIALARVPYNFNNSTEITGLKSGRSVVYAGESETIKYNAIVGIRRNNETDGTYATIVRKARLQLLACEGSCDSAGSAKYYTDVVNNVTLNSSGNLDGYTDPKEMSVNIPDLPAGSTMCFKSRVYPASVKNDRTVETEWESGGYTWAESAEQCYDVAKKPSFQVWGGSMYSAGRVDLGSFVIKKNNLSNGRGGYLDGYSYNINGNGNKRMFGSWTELSLVAGGAVTGISSGVGLGYSQANDALLARSGDGTSVGNLGGISGTDFCLVSTLSFANKGCSSSVGNLGGSSQGDSSNKSGLISRFVGNDVEYERISNVSGNISDVASWGVDGNGLVFEAVNAVDEYGDEVVDEIGNVKKKATRVIDASGNEIVVDKNIVYGGGNYTNLESVPKVIIYAENIKINCDVTRIDAVLIANGDVDTCNGVESENSRDRSRQLIVNGSIITDTLTLGRTYGAATGVNSIIPAEIVNYDSSLYLWANRQAGATKSGDLTESYITELAPRY